MIKKIETLSCIQEFVKDRQLMDQYFSANDINCLTKYCSVKLLDFENDDESDDISRLIQLLLNSDLHLHVNNYKDNVRHKNVREWVDSIIIIFICFYWFCEDFDSEKNVPVKHKRAAQHNRFASSVNSPEGTEERTNPPSDVEEIRKDKRKNLDFAGKVDLSKAKFRGENAGQIRNNWTLQKWNWSSKKAERDWNSKPNVSTFWVISIHIARGFFRKSSNINIINFCRQKDEAIDQKYTVTEEAREMYQQFLNENLSREKKMREKKLSKENSLFSYAFSVWRKSCQYFNTFNWFQTKNFAETRRSKHFKPFFTNMTSRLGKSEHVSLKSFAMHWNFKERSSLSGQKRYASHKSDCMLELWLANFKLFLIFFRYRHSKCMFEKEEAERREMEQAMMIFMMNRSAKILQKYDVYDIVLG